MIEQPIIAIYDANIIYPAPLRDLLIRIAQSGLVLARWSETIHDEWTRNVLKANPHLSAKRLARTRSLMNEAVRDCLVTGHKKLISTLSLSDPEDRHVLAAAICAKAAVIVTFNLKDFRAKTLGQFDIKAQHPAAFLADLLNQSAGLVCAAVKRQRESLRNPQRTIEELLTTLENQGLIQTVIRLRQYIDLL